jgi:hypothetical protein
MWDSKPIDAIFDRAGVDSMRSFIKTQTGWKPFSELIDSIPNLANRVEKLEKTLELYKKWIGSPDEC